MEALMTKDHAATFGGQDSSFKLQLKWISALPNALPPLLQHLPSPTWSLDFSFLMCPSQTLNWEGSLFCNLAHTLTMNTADWYLLCARNHAKHFIYFISLIVPVTLGDGHFPVLSFTGEGSDVSRGQVTCPKSYSCKWQSWDVPLDLTAWPGS